MRDDKFESLINKCYELGNKHNELLKLVEEEYEKRFGYNPSDINDDWWIDTLQYCHAKPNFNILMEQARLSTSLEKTRINETFYKNQ